MRILRKGFFLKKEAKTFYPFGYALSREAAQPTDKSFLLLFFKKEALLFCLLSLLSACAEPPPNSAAACALERRGEFQLNFGDGLPTIPVTLDGSSGNLLFDTGASMTTLSAVAAARMDLLHNGNMRITSHGIGGKSEAIAADVARFRIGDMELQRRTVMVIPFELRGFKAGPPDGLLGFDIFSQFDVEFDLMTGRGTFYRPRNCPSAVPNWLLASNRFVIPSTTPSGKLQIEVELDGKRLVATVDTGAGGTLVSSAAAAKLGVTAQQLSSARAIAGYGVAPTDVQMRVVRFRELRVGQETAKTPELAITDLPPGAGDMLLGMNYLRNRKLWISLSSRTLHLSIPQAQTR